MMKYKRQIEELILCVWVCVFDRKLLNTELEDEWFDMSIRDLLDVDFSPYQRNDAAFWNYWETTNITNKLDWIIQLELFEEEPQNQYQLDIQLVCLTEWCLRCTVLDKVIKPYFARKAKETKSYEDYRPYVTFRRLLGTMLQQCTLLSAMKEPTATQTEPEPTKGGAHVTEWLVKYANDNRDIAQKAIDEINLYMNPQPYDVLSIIDEYFGIDKVNGANLARGLSECVGRNISKQNVSTYKTSKLNRKKQETE